MLLDKRTLQLGDDILIDVVPQSEFVHISVGNSKKFPVRKVDIWAVCFAIADAKTQELLMPVRKTEMSTFRRVHHVKLTKDVKAGEMVHLKCEVNVPQIVEEGLAGSLMKKRSRILMP
jgi:hypothetical protein